MSGSASPPSLPPPPASGVAGGSVTSRNGKIAAVVLLCLAVLALWFLLGGADPPRRQQDDVGASAGAPGASRVVHAPPPERPAPPENPNAQREAANTAPQPRFLRVQQPQPRKAAPIMGWEAPEDRREDAPGARARGDGGAEGDDDPLSARLVAARTPTAKAKRLRNREYLIPQGTMLPVIRETRINTQLPGMVRARIPVDVMGDTGGLALLPANTVLTGQVQQSLAHGTTRAFVLWTRARTPDGVIVELGSPGTDPLGQNGVELDVRTNFWARFGGALMLSFADAGLQAAAIGLSSVARTGANGQSVNFFQLQNSGRSAAATALNATVNIPPWGTAPEGEAEAVFTARDLDFAGVYRVEVR